MNLIKRYVSSFINLKMGLIGAFIMAGIVFMINLPHGWVSSSIAGLKQWVYTFFFGGMIIRLLEYALSIKANLYLSILLSVIGISVLTTLLVYLVHSMRGTPEPLLSTIPTMIMAPPGFLALAIHFKKRNSRRTADQRSA